MSELARRSRWCDQSILDERNSGFSSGPLRGRLSVWNSRRGNHLGQRSCASAPTGRTYGRKRSDQSTANHLARRGPSTYGKWRIRLITENLDLKKAKPKFLQPPRKGEGKI